MNLSDGGREKTSRQRNRDPNVHQSSSHNVQGGVRHISEDLTAYSTQAYGTAGSAQYASSVEVLPTDLGHSKLRVTPDVAAASHAVSALDTAAPIFAINLGGNSTPGKWRN